jgi:hypothetical protein
MALSGTSIPKVHIVFKTPAQPPRPKYSHAIFRQRLRRHFDKSPCAGTARHRRSTRSCRESFLVRKDLIWTSCKSLNGTLKTLTTSVGKFTASLESQIKGVNQSPQSLDELGKRMNSIISNPAFSITSPLPSLAEGTTSCAIDLARWVRHSAPGHDDALPPEMIGTAL